MRTNNIQRNLFPILSLLTKVAFAFVLLIVVANAAMAYTLVFRDGHKVEVPTVFIVTTTTLTYEAAPGINRTVQLILIDVSATERANNEAPGGFFKHAERSMVASAPALTRHAQHTLTNLDLEPIRQRRIESEQKYEQRRIELGLPSIEETRRRQAEEEAATTEWLRERSLAQRREESFWRERAGTLRSEIVAVDAEINYLRARLSEFGQFPLATHSLITSVLPFGPLNSRSAVGPRVANPGRFVAPRGSAPNGRGQVLINPAPQTFRGVRTARPVAGFGIGPAFPFAARIRPFDYLEGSYDRADLSGRLDTLLQTRAGLTARWRELEDEARDAKAPQVWLEP